MEPPKKKGKDYDYSNDFIGCRCYGSTGNPCKQQNGNGQVKSHTQLSPQY